MDSLRQPCLPVAVVLLAAFTGAAWQHSTRPRGPVYLGRPLSHWEREARSWEPCYLGEDHGGSIFWRHRPPPWQEGLWKLGVPSERSSSSCPLLEADPEAVPVLARLLESPDSGVRLLAADGLKKIGPEASSAIPALRVALQDEDGAVRLQAEQALRSVDPDAGGRQTSP